MLSQEMKQFLHVFAYHLSLVVKHICTENNAIKEIQINDRLYITLLDKEQLYVDENKETFPNFEYTIKKINKGVGKVIKIKDSKVKTFRNMLAKQINLKDKNEEELLISNKDFRVVCYNTSLFLIMMSLLRNSHSLNVYINPLIIVNKEYYYLLNFKDPQIKFLRIHCDRSNYYPVN